MRPVVLFDGYCNLCNGAVTFILKNEADSTLLFSSLSSNAGKQFLQERWTQDSAVPDSIIVIDRDGIYVKSDAALYIAGHLKTPWRFLSYFKWVPRPVRDVVYDLIARNRYRVFGRQDTCMIPQPECISRFIDSEVKVP